MMEFFVDNLSTLCEKPSMEHDFIVDGLLFCGDCKTPKQHKVEMFGITKKVFCQCNCAAESYKIRAEKEREAEEMKRIEKLKTQGIQDKQIRDWTFANDDNSNPNLSHKAMRYYSNWQQMYKDNIGLLLWGSVGTGKTFFAACIANGLLSNGIPVMMTNFAKIINAMSGFELSDKNNYIDSFNRYKLLIIDDLGAERQSEFAQEIVYSVIDARYKNGQPLIITTNMTLNEIKEPKNITYSRIYDRILEMCVPIIFEGESRRTKTYDNKRSITKAMFL